MQSPFNRNSKTNSITLENKTQKPKQINKHLSHDKIGMYKWHNSLNAMTLTDNEVADRKWQRLRVSLDCNATVRKFFISTSK